MPKDDEPYLVVTLGVPVLEALIKSAKAACNGGSGNGPFVRLEIPTAAQHYPNGDQSKGLTSALRVRITGMDVDVVGCAMPVRS